MEVVVVLTEALVQVNVFNVSLIFMLLGKENDKAHHRGNDAGSLHSKQEGENNKAWAPL